MPSVFCIFRQSFEQKAASETKGANETKELPQFKENQKEAQNNKKLIFNFQKIPIIIFLQFSPPNSFIFYRRPSKQSHRRGVGCGLRHGGASGVSGGHQQAARSGVCKGVAGHHLG